MSAALTTSLFVHFRTAFRASHRKPEILSYKFLQEIVSPREGLADKPFLVRKYFLRELAGPGSSKSGRRHCVG